MSNLIKTRHDEPFLTEKSAQMRGGTLAKEGTMTEVVDIEGGYALKKIGEIKEEVVAPTEDKPKRREKRIPLGSRNVLVYPKRKGFERRVFNDIDDRVLSAENAGWVAVADEDLADNKAGRATRMGLKARKPVGGGVHGVLMEIPQEFYDEDQQAKQDEIKLLEDDMKRNRGNVEGAYGSIDIK